MNERDFWILYNRFMSSSLTYEQKQVFYFAAKMRYQGSTPEQHGEQSLKWFKKLLKKVR